MKLITTSQHLSYDKKYSESGISSIGYSELSRVARRNAAVPETKN